MPWRAIESSTRRAMPSIRAPGELGSRALSPTPREYLPAVWAHALLTMPIFQRRTGCRRPKRTRRLDPLKLNSLAKVKSVTADQSFGLTSQCLGKAREPRTPSFQAVRSPRGGPAWTERGNGHRTSCSAGWADTRWSSGSYGTNPEDRLRGDAGHLGHEPPRFP